jgi:hypothetical protein
MTKIKFTPGQISAYAMPDDHVALILPPNAAQFLADIGASIGGSSTTTRRCHSDEINRVLRKLGFSWDRLNVNGRRSYRADVAMKHETPGYTFLDNPDKDKRKL